MKKKKTQGYFPTLCLALGCIVTSVFGMAGGLFFFQHQSLGRPEPAVLPTAEDSPKVQSKFKDMIVLNPYLFLSDYNQDTSSSIAKDIEQDLKDLRGKTEEELSGESYWDTPRNYQMEEFISQQYAITTAENLCQTLFNRQLSGEGVLAFLDFSAKEDLIVWQGYTITENDDIFVFVLEARTGNALYIQLFPSTDSIDTSVKEYRERIEPVLSANAEIQIKDIHQSLDWTFRSLTRIDWSPELSYSQKGFEEVYSSLPSSFLQERVFPEEGYDWLKETKYEVELLNLNEYADIAYQKATHLLNQKVIKGGPRDSSLVQSIFLNISRNSSNIISVQTDIPALNGNPLIILLSPQGEFLGFQQIQNSLYGNLESSIYWSVNVYL